MLAVIVENMADTSQMFAGISRIIQKTLQNSELHFLGLKVEQHIRFQDASCNDQRRCLAKHGR